MRGGNAGIARYRRSSPSAVLPGTVAIAVPRRPPGPLPMSRGQPEERQILMSKMFGVSLIAGTHLFPSFCKMLKRTRVCGRSAWLFPC